MCRRWRGQIVVDQFEPVDVAGDDAHRADMVLLDALHFHIEKSAAAQAGEGVVSDQVFQLGPVALGGGNVRMQPHKARGPALGVAMGHIAAPQYPGPGAVARISR